MDYKIILDEALSEPWNVFVHVSQLLTHHNQVEMDSFSCLTIKKSIYSKTQDTGMLYFVSVSPSM